MEEIGKIDKLENMVSISVSLKEISIKIFVIFLVLKANKCF